MVEEAEILRRAVGTPAPDQEARERARASLREAMALEQRVGAVEGRPRPLLRPVRWLGAAAAIVAVVLLAQTVLPPHQGGPSTSAAGELRKLASVASSLRPIKIPPGHFLYKSSEVSGVFGLTSLTASVEAKFFEEETVEDWIAADGSVERITTIHHVSFLTDQDRDAWLNAESPPPLPEVGRDFETFADDQLVHFDLSDLPTDPDKLGTLIRSGKVIIRGSRDLDVLSVVGTLLASAPASPELRASLFQVAADLPSIELLGPVQDPWGRTGIGVQIVGGANAHELIFDPSTSELLALLTVPTAGGAPISSEVYRSSRIVDWAPGTA